jgi:cytochrome c oxidase subunit 4
VSDTTFDEDHGAAHAHVMPVSTLLAVFAFLVAMTLVTVASAGVFHGAVGVTINMGIASLKALAVVLFFMHLKYDKPLNSLIFLFSFVFFFLFMVFTVIDSLQYQPEVLNWQISRPPPPAATAE